MKLRIFVLTCIMLLVISPLATIIQANNANADKIIILLNTRQFYQDNTMHLSKSPHVVRNGVTYVAMRSLAERLQYQVLFDQSTNEYIMKNSENELRFKANSKAFSHNGQVLELGSGAPYIEKGTLMVPLRTVTNRLSIPLTAKLSENKIELTWKKAGQVTTPPPPTAPVQPLEADFMTNKDSYKIGELVQYEDLSKGGNSEIIRRTWTNNMPAFFSPGHHMIVLEVENRQGQVSQVTKTITIEDEVLRTEDQFYAMYTPYGDKFNVDRQGVLSYPVIPYTMEERDVTLIRSNSPEKFIQEGIYYRDRVQGNVRFFFHHENARPNRVNIHLLVKNNGREAATIRKDHIAIGGPSTYVSQAGKASVARYLTALTKPALNETITVRPGETKVILEELLKQPIKTGNVLTMYADLHFSSELDFEIVVLDEINTLESTYPYLGGINVVRDGKHIRGTFPKGNRTLTVNQLVGMENGRLVIGDGKIDPYVKGRDVMSGFEETNNGNFGVVYELKLNRVAANTAIVINPRGGHYAGAFLVNNQVVNAPTTGIINNPSEVVSLYRTGNNEEEVTITFIPSAGSNLPINLLFLPFK
ncbi:stalk domain-containing protein [Anaerobacillus sp. MEB173]|uniref:stalk domain-containing protein n=1 Tax=Anaerobacillus sp. MEB173 TaxID=3383345 RepID=UPI003F90AE47